MWRRHAVRVDGGEQRGRRMGDPRCDATVGVDGGVQRGRRVGATTFLDGRVRVDGGLAEPCTKRLWTPTVAS
jgi:hypothetical protein